MVLETEGYVSEWRPRETLGTFLLEIERPECPGHSGVSAQAVCALKTYFVFQIVCVSIRNCHFPSERFVP